MSEAYEIIGNIQAVDTLELLNDFEVVSTFLIEPYRYSGSIKTKVVFKSRFNPDITATLEDSSDAWNDKIATFSFKEERFASQGDIRECDGAHLITLNMLVIKKMPKKDREFLKTVLGKLGCEGARARYQKTTREIEKILEEI